MVRPVKLRDDLKDVLTDTRGVCDPPGNLLGIYTDKSKRTFPAISISPVAEKFTVAGLECVIPLIPEIEAYATLGMRFVHREETHTIHLIQHPSGNDTLYLAVERLTQWSPSCEVYMMPYADTLDLLPQATIKLHTFELVPCLSRLGEP